MDAADKTNVEMYFRVLISYLKLITDEQLDPKERKRFNKMLDQLRTMRDSL